MEESTDVRLKRMVKHNGDYKAYFSEEQILIGCSGVSDMQI